MYLHSSPFPIQVFTDHKNLTYFCQAQNLNHHQARWLLNLADFNLKIIHVPGCLLASPDALSHHSDLYPNDSHNSSTILLPDTLFVNLTDIKPHECISNSSNSDPLILQHLQWSLEDVPMAFQSCLSDWKYNDHVLTYKGHVYVPPAESLCRSILAHCHDYETVMIYPYSFSFGLIFSFLMITHPSHVISLLTTLVFIITSFHLLLWTSMTLLCLLTVLLHNSITFHRVPIASSLFQTFLSLWYINPQLATYSLS